MKIQSLEVLEPSDLDRAFSTFARERADALIVLDEAFTLLYATRVAELAVKHRLPTVHSFRAVATDPDEGPVHGSDADSTRPVPEPATLGSYPADGTEPRLHGDLGCHERPSAPTSGPPGLVCGTSIRRWVRVAPQRRDAEAQRTRRSRSG